MDTDPPAACAATPRRRDAPGTDRRRPHCAAWCSTSRSPRRRTTPVRTRRSPANAGPPAAADGAALATLIGKLVRGVERGGRHWTSARRKDSLQRVLEGSRSDAKRLQQRLTQLAASWDSRHAGRRRRDRTGSAGRAGGTRERRTEIAPAAAPISLNLTDERPWGRVVGTLGSTTRQALPPNDARRRSCRRRWPAWSSASAAKAPRRRWPKSSTRLCRRAGIVLQHRHHLVDQLGAPVPGTDRQPDRSGRGRQLGQGPVRCDARQARRGPDRARRARRQRTAARHARAPGHAARRARDRHARR